MSERPPKTVTAEEANVLLPTVIPIVEQLQGLQRSIVQTNQRRDDAIGKLSQGNGHPVQSLKTQVQHLTTHQLQLIEAFQSALTQLETLGVVVKDLAMGLLDFYSLRDGEIICLCWKLGEPRVSFWHTLDDGYAGRQPLEP